MQAVIPPPRGPWLFCWRTTMIQPCPWSGWAKNFQLLDYDPKTQANEMARKRLEALKASRKSGSLTVWTIWRVSRYLKPFLEEEVPKADVSEALQTQTLRKIRFLHFACLNKEQEPTQKPPNRRNQRYIRFWRAFGASKRRRWRTKHLRPAVVLIQILIFPLIENLTKLSWVALPDGMDSYLSFPAMQRKTGWGNLECSFLQS